MIGTQIKKNKTIFSLAICIAFCITGTAQSLLSKVDSLTRRYTFYDWDSTGKIYLTTYGSLERQFPYPIFIRIEIDKKSGFLSIEGFVSEDGVSNTYGKCCFEILVAKTDNNEYLSNIRRFEKTLEATDTLNTSRLDGWFSLKVKLGTDDILLIGNPGTVYWGATLVPLGKILAK